LKKQDMRKSIDDYEKLVHHDIIKFRYIIESFSTIMDYILNGRIEYEYSFSPSMVQADIVVNIVTEDYELILNMIKTYRPRIKVLNVEVQHNNCLLYLDYNIDWSSKDFNYNTPSISTYKKSSNFMGGIK